MSEEGDDRLLESLGKALAPPPAEPSEAELGALNRAVAERFAAPTDRSLRAWWSRNRRRYGGRRAIFALVAAVALTTTGTAVALSGGAGFTAPLRTMARAVGLPVESPGMARAKETMGRLRKALIERDAREVRKGVADVQARVDALEASERTSVDAEKEALLAEADRFLKALAAKAEKRKRSRAAAPDPLEDEGAEREDDPNEEAPLFEDDDDEGPDEAEEEDRSDKGHEFDRRGPLEMGDDNDDDEGGGDHDDDDHNDDDDHDDDNDNDKEEPEEHP